MNLNELWRIMRVFVLALWVGPSAALAEADWGAWNTSEFFSAATPSDIARCLEAGADLAARDEKGWTPFDLIGNHSQLVGTGAGSDCRARGAPSPAP